MSFGVCKIVLNLVLVRGRYGNMFRNLISEHSVVRFRCICFKIPSSSVLRQLSMASRQQRHTSLSSNAGHCKYTHTHTHTHMLASQLVNNSNRKRMTINDWNVYKTVINHLAHSVTTALVFMSVSVCLSVCLVTRLILFQRNFCYL